MTVSELIDALAQLPGDTVVVVEAGDIGLSDVRGVYEVRIKPSSDLPPTFEIGEWDEDATGLPAALISRADDR